MPSVEPGRAAVRVKALEWFQSSPATWRSQTPVNGYIVEKGNKYWRVLPLTPAFIFDTEAEAKTAAQVDYERRILSALEPSSSEPSRDAATAMADAVTVFKHSGGDVEACRNAIRAYAASAAFAAQSEIEGLREARDEARKRANDLSYMLLAFRNMLGPKGLEVAEMWTKKGVSRIHLDWGPSASSLTGEERAQFILDVEAAPSTEVVFDGDDGRALSAKGE